MCLWRGLGGRGGGPPWALGWRLDPPVRPPRIDASGWSRFDPCTLDDWWVDGAAAEVIGITYRGGGHGDDGLLAVDGLGKRTILPIEPSSLCSVQCDEPLTAGGVRIVGSGHRQDAEVMAERAGLKWQPPSRSA